jgi:glycosyltransferase involved in cell wall biosynthesis
MLKVLALSKYGTLGASSRLRIFQYIPVLKQEEIDISIFPLLDNDYLEALYHQSSGKLLSLINGYFKRIIKLIQSKRYDFLWIQGELFPWTPPLVETFLYKLNIPYIVDYDDAIFHNYDQHPNAFVRRFLGKKIDTVIKFSSLVSVGNSYLEKRAKSAGAKWIEYLPTVLDHTRYNPKIKQNKKTISIVWIGSPSTMKYLKDISPVLSKVAKKRNIKLVVIGGGHFEVENLQVECLPWQEETEAHDILKGDIGIMPLRSSPWEEGKCGYKLIQYMACGLPVVASPVGANCVIVQNNVNGFLASELQEWEEAVIKLIDNYQLRKQMGENGRKRVEERYSLEIWSGKLLALFTMLKKNIDNRVS